MVKLLIDEEGSAEVEAAMKESIGVATSALSRVEAHSALSRAREGGRLSASQYRAGASSLEKIWPRIAAVEADDAVIEAAVGLVRRHPLRAFDALQLASALTIGGSAAVSFMSWDAALNRAAENEGLGPPPE